MNDLRSLEGIELLLSQKRNINQNNKHRMKSKPPYLRKSSVPLMLSPMYEYFPPETASLLSTRIRMGYYHMPSRAPVLLKSHSDFVREDVLNDLSESNHFESFVPFDDHMINLYDVQDEEDVIVLNLPTEMEFKERELSLSISITLAPPPPSLICSPVPNTNHHHLSNHDLIHDIVHYLQDEQEDIEYINIKNEYMEYESRNTKNAFNNIGIGASGILRKAFHYKSCKMIAIKRCRCADKYEQNAFIKESNLYKEFEHNINIINMLEFGRNADDMTLCIALEYMDLGSIDALKIHETVQYMKQRELIVAHIMYNVLNALNEIHESLYVHNDIKPANILSNKYGEIKLSDFGTTLKLEDKHSYLSKNNGTQRYQSPEKLTQQTCKYNTKTDIWSLGITCFELLFGPRNDKNDLSYIINKPKLSAKKHKLSRNCCDFIAQCLCDDHKRRASAQELLQHKWFMENVKPKAMHEKWPWLVQNECYNEDLLFMISALIIHYSKQSVNLEASSKTLHRRVSHYNHDYSDEERIGNIAHYALCSKDLVLQRIRATVAYIKSQLNKAELFHS